MSKEEKIVELYLGFIVGKVAQIQASEEAARTFLQRFPEWHVFAVGLLYAYFRRCVAPTKYSWRRQGLASWFDLMPVAYLPNVTHFITSDKDQIRMLRIANLWNPRKARVLSWSCLKRELLVNGTQAPRGLTSETIT
jgi:hypothetical protein